jgi:hypothetical protein
MTFIEISNRSDSSKNDEISHPIKNRVKSLTINAVLKFNKINEFQVNIDLDGVLADFKNKSYEIFGDNFNEILSNSKHRELKWTTINNYNKSGLGFFESLNYAPGAIELLEKVKVLQDVFKFKINILTGIPCEDEMSTASQQKKDWCKKHVSSILGDNYTVTACRPRYKNEYSKPSSILIDDRKNYEETWNKFGGKFIYHPENAFDDSGKSTSMIVKETIINLFNSCLKFSMHN